jgi:predicted nucleotidyltransferase
MGAVNRSFDEDRVSQALRTAGARFAFIHGSRAHGAGNRPDSDLDVAAWWGINPPQPWEVEVPSDVDLVVLDRAPLWLAGRIALGGRLLFEDDRRARVAWQADTRRIWLDEKPRLLASQHEFRQAVIARG